jgi:mono/diheme cytochrome c family protein
MNHLLQRALRAATLAFLAAWSTCVLAQGDAQRGWYLVKAGGCLGCHTADEKDAVPFAGGRALATPFGTFYGPNITPHQQAGIGRWSEADFRKAMRHGVRPDGANYFPSFPYPSFTLITDGDLADLWAYLRVLPQSARPSREHDLRFPFGWRFAVTFWKWLYFKPGPLAPGAGSSAAVSRGAYLVDGLGHCGECHTPRNFMGGFRRDRYLAGGKTPEGKDVSNLTPTNLKKWGDKDLADFLSSGTTPDGDSPAEAMAEVIRNTTSRLTPQDLQAMVAYLRSVPAIADEPEPKKK